MFTKEKSKQIKGIAILLMLAHHLYTFSERMPYGADLGTPFEVSGLELTKYIGTVGKICVPIFMFLGGYGFFCSENTGREKRCTDKKLLMRIVKLYCSYWKVFLIYIPLGYLFFAAQEPYCPSEYIYTKFDNFSLKTLISNFIGWSCELNGEWWFFSTYLFAMFEGMVFAEIFRNRKCLYLEYTAIISWYILVSSVFPQIAIMDGWKEIAVNHWFGNLFLISEYAVVFLAGIIVAKYEIFSEWKQWIDKLLGIEKNVLLIIVIVLITYVRTFICGNAFDIILCPVFIFSCYILIDEVAFLRRPLLFLGNHSTNMWLIHTFYCYYFYPFVRLVYGSNNALIAYLVLLILSVGSSMMVDRFWVLISLVYGRISKRASTI